MSNIVPARRRRPVGLIVAIAAALLVQWAVMYFVLSGIGGFAASGFLELSAADGRSLWMELRGSRVRMAANQSALSQAAWQRMGKSWEEDERIISTDFLIILRNNSGEMRGNAVSFSRDYGDCEASWQLTGTAPDGKEWSCTFTLPCEPVHSPEEVTPIALPESLQPALKMEASEQKTEAGGPGLSVALTLSPGEDKGEINDFARAGNPAKALVRILDSEGKVVISKTGALDDFGYT